MASCKLLFLVFIAVSLLGVSNGYDDQICEDEVYCSVTQRPSTYDMYQEDIDKIIQTSRYWNPHQNIEDMEPELGGDNENCHTITEVEQPYSIIVNKSSHILVQTPLLEQKIRVTKCLQNGARCFETSNPLFETFCKTKYGNVSLYVYDPVSKGLKYKTFDIPVCCTCEIRTSFVN